MIVNIVDSDESGGCSSSEIDSVLLAHFYKTSFRRGSPAILKEYDMFKQWLNSIFPTEISMKRGRRAACRMGCSKSNSIPAEVLETRTLLTVFVVNTVTDDLGDFNGTSDGQLSLREAIRASNTNTPFGDAAAGSIDGDSIVFATSLSGATINVAQGEFAISDDLQISGLGLSSAVTLNANRLSRVFAIETVGSVGSNSSVALTAMTLSNGEASSGVKVDGGALWIADSEDVMLTDLTIQNSVAQKRGGAIFNGTGGLTIRGNSVIKGNIAAGATAADGGGGIFNNGGTLSIGGVSAFVAISNNRASGASGSGGGIFSTGGNVTITDATLGANTANRAGGGLEIGTGTVRLNNVNLIGNDVNGSAGTANPGNGGGLHVTGIATVTLDGGSVFGNAAAREGGGLWNQAGATLIIQNGTLIQSNDALGAAADDGGGGVFNNGGIVRIDGTLAPVEIAGNRARGTLGSGGGIFNFTGGVVTITNATIRDNEAERAGGGIEDAANVVGVTGMTLTRVSLINNFAIGTHMTAPGNGGGLHITGAGRTLIVNSTVSGNTADLEGGGLWNSSTGTLTIRNSTVTDNSATGVGNGGGIKTTGGTTTLTNTIVAGNESGGGRQSDDINGSVAVTSATNLIGNAASSGGLTNGSNGNIVGIAGVGTRPVAEILNPVLADNGGGSLTHLLILGSVAIDAGTDLTASGVTVDQRGVTRPKNVRFDIGAVEFDVPGVTGRKWLDINGDGVRLPNGLVDLGFFAQNGKFFFNVFGGQEKWVRAANQDWYFIRPDGSLTKWSNTPGQLTGTVVARLPTRFYRDEYLLIEAVNEPFLNGWTIELLNSAGVVIGTSMTMDRDLNTNGSIDPETERGVYQFDVLVTGTYSIREVLQAGFVQSAGASAVDALAAYDLDQARGLVYTGDYHTNFGGRGENWLRQSTGWVYILPDGSVYSWDNSSGGANGLVNGTFLKKLNPAFHTNPQLLSDAMNPRIGLTAGSVVAGPQFGNYRPTTISGRVFEDTNRNGIRESTELFTNNRIVELVDRDGNVVRQVRSADVESDGNPGIDPNVERGVYQFTNVVPGTYTVRHVIASNEIQTAPFSPVADLAYRLDQQFRLSFTGKFFESFGTNQERFLYSDSVRGWVYLTKAGDLFRWNPASGPAPKPLSGTLIARLDASFYTNPSKLYNAPSTNVQTISGGVLTNYDLGYLDVDAAFSGSNLFE